MEKRYVCGRADELPEGGRLLVEVAGRSIGIFCVDGRFHALVNRCPHQGAELCRGEVVPLVTADAERGYRIDGSRRLLVCPWHGWEFDLETGRSYLDPARTRVKAMHVDVESGAALREGPYRAEVVPIEVERDYLVITLGG